MPRPVTTLFILSSVDGKISTGSSEERDFDTDFPLIPGVREGLGQYYDLEKQTDFWSLNTGRVMAKVGMNEKAGKPPKLEKLRFVIVDSKPHLKESGIDYLAKKLGMLYIVTTNDKHPGLKNRRDNVVVIFYENKIDFQDLFRKLKKEYGCNSLTIQSGGSLNAVLLRKNLIDRLSLVIAPALIGGKDTPSITDGDSLSSNHDLKHVKALNLVKCRVLKNSYLHLEYEVMKEIKPE